MYALPPPSQASDHESDEDEGKPEVTFKTGKYECCAGECRKEGKYKCAICPLHTCGEQHGRCIFMAEDRETLLYVCSPGHLPEIVDVPGYVLDELKLNMDKTILIAH